MFLIVQKSFFAIVKGLRLSKERVTNLYGDMRRNKKGKLPQKRQFITVFALQIFAVDFRFSLCYNATTKGDVSDGNKRVIHKSVHKNMSQS